MYLRTADAETRWQPIEVIITKRCSNIDKLYVSLVSFSSAQLNSIQFGKHSLGHPVSWERIWVCRDVPCSGCSLPRRVD